MEDELNAVNDNDNGNGDNDNENFLKETKSV